MSTPTNVGPPRIIGAAVSGCTCPHDAADHGNAGCEHTRTGPSVLRVCPCNGTTPPHRYACKSCGGESPVGIGYAVTDADKLPAPDPTCVGPHVRPRGCSCSQHSDGTVTTSRCPLHATTDPCLTLAWVTGRRRTGTIRRGVCTACGHGAAS